MDQKSQIPARSPHGARRIRGLRWALFALAAAALYALAVSGAVYETTSPSWLSFHVLLRKGYSLVAFALIGFLLDLAMRSESASPPRYWAVGAAIACYSALIEGGQRLAGSLEGPAWNALDVALGFVGGLIGAVASNIRGPGA